MRFSIKWLIALFVLSWLLPFIAGCTGNGARDIAMLAVAGKFKGKGAIRTSGRPFGVGADTNWYIGSETVADFDGTWDFSETPDWLIDILKGKP